MLASPWVCVAASRARGTPVIGLRTQLWVCAAASRARGTPAIGLQRGSFSIRACAPVVGDFATAMGFAIFGCQISAWPSYQSHVKANVALSGSGQRANGRFIRAGRLEWSFYQQWLLAVLVASLRARKSHPPTQITTFVGFRVLSKTVRAFVYLQTGLPTISLPERPGRSL